MNALRERHHLARTARELRERQDNFVPPGRKTSRTRATPTHVAPELKLVFLLPRTISAFVAPGPHGIGVTVGEFSTVAICMQTFGRERLFTRAAEFLQRITPRDHVPFSLAASMTSSSEPGWKMQWRLVFVDGHVMAAITPVEALIFPRKH